MSTRPSSMPSFSAILLAEFGVAPPREDHQRTLRGYPRAAARLPISHAPVLLGQQISTCVRYHRWRTRVCRRTGFHASPSTVANGASRVPAAIDSGANVGMRQEATLRDLAVYDGGARPHFAIRRDAGGAAQGGERPHDDARRQRHPGLDDRRRRVDDRHAFEHPPAFDAVAHDAFGFGQFDRRVDAENHARIVHYCRAPPSLPCARRPAMTSVR